MIFKNRGFIFPSDEVIRSFRGNLKVWLVRKMIYLRIAAIALVVVALMRPQAEGDAKTKKEGIAAVISIDCSSTMLADSIRLGFEDFAGKRISSASRQMKRIDAAREAAKNFIKNRPDDMIGLVAFAADAYVVSPLTFDHGWLLSGLDGVKVGLIKDATAIGSGILAGLQPLKDTKAKSRIIILITDGINNFGHVPPLVAAKAARALGIKVYTVGLVNPQGASIDEGELKRISDTTGGKYFRAENMAELRESFRQIDGLEKIEMEESVFQRREERFGRFLFPALIVLLLEIFLGNTFLRRIP